MNIEQIEKIVMVLMAQLDEQAEEASKEAFFEVVVPVMQLQLLLLIYHKLEALEEQGQTKPGA